MLEKQHFAYNLLYKWTIHRYEKHREGLGVLLECHASIVGRNGMGFPVNLMPVTKPEINENIAICFRGEALKNIDHMQIFDNEKDAKD